MLNVLLVGLLASALASPYGYLNYDAIVVRMRDLAQQHPELVDFYDAQSAFGVPSPGTCSENGASAPCKQYYMRITKKSTLPAVGTMDTRPEVFLSGCLHGDERIGPTTVTELATLLLHNYNATSPNQWLKRLVETRSIWIMPSANALGYHQNVREENGVDPNRDFAFDQLPGSVPCLAFLSPPCFLPSLSTLCDTVFLPTLCVRV